MNQGDLLCVKSTGELVTFLNEGLQGELCCRRGRLTQNGIIYVKEKFAPFEVETPELYLNRKAEAYMLNLKMQKSVIGKKIAELERDVEDEVDAPENIPFKSRPN